MRNGRIPIIINVLVMLSATHAYGLAETYPFRQRAQKSDLIVEGVVQKQMDMSDYDGKDLHSFRKKSVFKITKVYKGNITEGDNITIFSHMNFLCDTSKKLVEKHRYLLMLKRRKDGFEDVNYGRGMWEIVTLETDKQFMAGDLLASAWGRPYEQFKEDIAWALSEPPSWPEKPTISAKEAKNIALEVLSRGKGDLKGFRLKKQKLFNIGSDIIGFAYKGDPMWFFDWEKPETQDESPGPPGSFFSCYVHAHTGRFYSKSNKEIPEAKNVCRLFLKTHGHYRQIYGKHADNITINQITEEEFRNYLPCYWPTFLKAKSSYPKDAAFLKISFPANLDVNPMIFVLDPAGHIDFAGIIIPEIEAKRKFPI